MYGSYRSACRDRFVERNGTLHFTLQFTSCFINFWQLSHLWFMKMYDVPIFAGLGSNSLFEQRTLATAVEDAKLPEAEILLHACHQIFLTETAKAHDIKILSPDIDLEDFKEAQNLLMPLERYRRNVVLQHITLYLIQLLRYIRYFSRPSKSRHLGVAGFCAGLLPAVAVASSKNLIELLSQSQNIFYIVLWLGIRCENFTRHDVANNPCQPDLPWSMVIDGLSSKRMKEILVEHEIIVRLLHSLLQIMPWLVNRSQPLRKSTSVPSIQMIAALWAEGVTIYTNLFLDIWLHNAEQKLPTYGVCTTTEINSLSFETNSSKTSETEWPPFRHQLPLSRQFSLPSTAV